MCVCGGGGGGGRGREREREIKMSCSISLLSAQPIHWIYSEEALAKAVEGVNPEFLPKSVNPFYTLPTGQQSPYGDVLLVMLESLVACKGTMMM